MWTGSTGTVEEGGTVTECAAVPAVGRTGGPLDLVDVG